MSKKLPTEPYKGVRDFYPEDFATLKFIFDTWRQVAHKVGYVEYEASILEPSDLYRAKGAENEEMISDQSYTFVDRGEREVTLRPEMTPTVARMVAGRRRELGYPLRYFSIPNCFRYERTQRGRLREFWQLNVDIFGSKSPAADAEILSVAYGMMMAFGASESDFVIKVGSRSYINAAIAELGLSDEGAKKLFALLDRRAKMPREEFLQALAELSVPESMILPEEPPADVAEMLGALKDAGLGNIVWDPSVVRGFAYYTGMVFEVFDTHADNNRALMGGGRYDNLTALFDDEPLPGVGFAIGDVTMRDFLDVRGLLPAYVPPTKLYIATPSPELAYAVQALAGELRRAGVNVAVDFGEKKLGDQIKAASKHRIPWLMVVGENELERAEFVVRNLETGHEETLPQGALADFLLNN
ncbi:MAG: histidine--tRNA ligase [Candidatus Pacebacteria bacterium]|nr:histidine--tRNA ligase [Candidatus Paceibacterota bacterium]